ncbi:hypothetical protein QQP08_022607, partial [Theobroma cacao]
MLFRRPLNYQQQQENQAQQTMLAKYGNKDANRSLTPLQCNKSDYIDKILNMSNS